VFLSGVIGFVAFFIGGCFFLPVSNGIGGLALIIGDWLGFSAVDAAPGEELTSDVMDSDMMQPKHGLREEIEYR